MTQEEELLLKDLYARQPYKVKISVDEDYDLFIPRLKYIDYVTCHFYECAWTRYINEIKPYLRPISSMTEEELKELLSYAGLKEHEIEICKYDGGAELEFWLNEVPCKYIIKVIDWLNKKMFDYRGLIPMDLAIEAKEGMYNTKQY